MGSRGRRLLTEVGRFLAVGGVATVVAFVLFNGLLHGLRPGGRAPLADHPILAYVLANGVGMVVSYHGTRFWAFRHRPTRHADGGRTAFLLVNIATMALPVLCLAVSRDVLGLDDPVSDNLAANVVGLALGVTARFWIFRTFVFRRPISLDEVYAVEELGDPAAPDGSVSAPTGRSSADPGRAPVRGAAGG